MAQQIEGDTNESYYLCEGIWFDKNQNKLVDKRDNNKELDITKIDDKVLIFEREVHEWMFFPMFLLLNDDTNNKAKYMPFKNAIFLLYGIFSYLEKIQRYRTGEPYQSNDTNATSLLCKSFQNIFQDENSNNYGMAKISKILEVTRHSLMHFCSIGDRVLLNQDYENSNAIKYIGSNNRIDKIEINPKKMLCTIWDDFDKYLKCVKDTQNKTEQDNFEKVFDVIYKDEIEQLTQGI